jgi:hypothetical protein
MQHGHGHGHAARICSTDIQHEQAAWRHGHAAGTSSMDMHQGHEACTVHVIQHGHSLARRHGHAAWTWTCSMGIDVQHWYGHSARI